MPSWRSAVVFSGWRALSTDRLLADSGFGGRRSIGWGRAGQPEFQTTTLEEIFPVAPESEPAPSPEPEPPAAEAEGAEPATEAQEPEETATPAVEPAPEPVAPPAPAKPAYWLLSLYCPAEAETSQLGGGSYGIVTRGGRVDSPGGPGETKKLLRMITEGSVLVSEQAPQGRAANVAPEGFPHPVYRYGFPVSLPIPAEVTR